MPGMTPGEIAMSSARARRRCHADIALAFVVVIVGATACSDARSADEARAQRGRDPASPSTSRRELDGTVPMLRGEPIDLDRLEGRIVFDDFEDLYVMRADGTNVRRLAGRRGPEFDGTWSPDGRWIAYRDSRRGINQDDEIYVVRADGSGTRHLSRHPANDWGPNWSPDGTTIVFNSDREGGIMGGYLVASDGSDLRRIRTDAWIEYPVFSPDGTRIAFMGQADGDYEIFVADVETGATRRLTDSPGSDGWPAWSPDGSMIAFASERDDCGNADRDADCWTVGGEGVHHDVWVMNADGSEPRRVTPEFGQFVTWSPDGRHLLISGASLYVIRPDGTGRVDVTTRGGGIPDWVA
jgi:TolB protein